ncbi:MAG: KpsF/GutQ family sugar-phosphate isomerase [Bryobacteraceae bacterium]|nr:KpsF/GutQ family sugar-phosphate isomerase [Bryobacteraceae bacterium]
MDAPELTPAGCGRLSIELASQALARTAATAEPAIQRAVELIASNPGKVVVTGMGKSGLIGRKISSTLTSTGTPAVFLHPAEAVHGDFGVYAPGEVTILLSNSGSTEELVRLLPTLKRFESPLIGILGNPASPLAKAVDVLLDASVDREGDPHSMVPTTSAIVALALGDALAVALMARNDFTPEDFGVFHPGGQIGRNLLLRVRDVMHTGDEVAWVGTGDSIKDVVIAMTQRPLGAACVVDTQHRLAGLITDGDLRRALRNHDDLRPLTATAIMTARPLTASPDLRLDAALRRMEDRPSQVSVLPVVAPDSGRALGLLRLHDILLGRTGQSVTK